MRPEAARESGRDFDPRWIEDARGGNETALGAMLESGREVLTRAARRRLPPDLWAKVGPSDLVQETFLAARRQVGQFRGRTDAEWRAWLLAILKNQAALARRHFLATDKRRINREVSLDAGVGSSMGHPGGPGALASPSTTPGGRAIRSEEEARLRVALAALPEHYRQVVAWHHEQQLGFDEIARRLGVSGEAARKFWGRALVRLRQSLGTRS